jgi:hypothetical protein
MHISESARWDTIEVLLLLANLVWKSLTPTAHHTKGPHSRAMDAPQHSQAITWSGASGVPFIDVHCWRQNGQLTACVALHMTNHATITACHLIIAVICVTHLATTF